MVGFRVFDVGLLVVWLVWFFRLRDDRQEPPDDESGGGGGGSRGPPGTAPRPRRRRTAPTARQGRARQSRPRRPPPGSGPSARRRQRGPAAARHPLPRTGVALARQRPARVHASRAEDLSAPVRSRLAAGAGVLVAELLESLRRRAGAGEGCRSAASPRAGARERAGRPTRAGPGRCRSRWWRCPGLGGVRLTLTGDGEGRGLDRLLLVVAAAAGGERQQPARERDRRDPHGPIPLGRAGAGPQCGQSLRSFCTSCSSEQPQSRRFSTA